MRSSEIVSMNLPTKQKSRRIDKEPLTDSELNDIRSMWNNNPVTIGDVAIFFQRAQQIVSYILGSKDDADAVMRRFSQRYLSMAPDRK